MKRNTYKPQIHGQATQEAMESLIKTFDKRYLRVYKKIINGMLWYTVHNITCNLTWHYGYENGKLVAEMI